MEPFEKCQSNFNYHSGRNYQQNTIAQHDLVLNLFALICGFSLPMPFFTAVLALQGPTFLQGACCALSTGLANVCFAHFASKAPTLLCPYPFLASKSKSSHACPLLFA